MSIWNRLFGARKTTSVTPGGPPTTERPVVLGRPTPLPGSPEAWAQELNANQDYAALAAFIYTRCRDNQWWPKVNAAVKILGEAGTDAVEEILQEISANG